MIECPDDFAASLPAQRIATVESGTSGQVVIGHAASKTEPFGIHLTDGGDIVGAISARYFPASELFKTQIVDADCHAQNVLSLNGEDTLEAILSYHTVRINLLDRAYVLNLGGGSEIMVNFSSFVP